MAHYITTSSYNSTGIKTITCGFAAKWVRITVGQKYNTSQTFSHLSIGAGDDTGYQVCDTFYQDASRGKTERHLNKIVSHWEYTGGAYVEKTTARLDAVNAPWTATQIKFIVDTADINYQYLIEIGD